MARMPWHAKPGSPGTARTVTPEPVYERIEFDPVNGFKDKVKWFRGDSLVYLRTECVFCGEEMGTCQGSTRFTQLKRVHRAVCKAGCGFPDCVDCHAPQDNLKTWVTYNAV